MGQSSGKTRVRECAGVRFSINQKSSELGASGERIGDE
jgi:hypothetical protein